MNRTVAKILSSSIATLPISIPLLSASCQNQNN
ncbi:variable surface lipoprotein [Mycoplasmopsis agalactiae]|nr:variable surface lipoprotein [Mycoplasmopsis agalactiae]